MMVNKNNLRIEIGDWPTDEEGEKAIQAVKDTMPSERQTAYNRRDIKKRKKKLIKMLDVS